MTGFYDSTLDIVRVIDDLNNTSQEISEITSVINGITEITTLLALNAAIEAARAGEYGKGFAVVAHEIGKLAEQSKQATDLISNLVSQMGTKMEQSVAVIQKNIGNIEKSKNLITNTNKTFEEIFKTLTQNITQISIVANSTRQMAESNVTVIDSISSIAAINEENLAGTEEVSATSEQQSASVQESNCLGGKADPDHRRVKTNKPN